MDQTVSAAVRRTSRYSPGTDSDSSAATAVLHRMQRLADEQAALRRVATLVARESPPAEIIAAVAQEVGRLLDIEAIRIVRYEDGGTVQVVASWGEPDAAVPVGTHVTPGDHSLASTVRRTARPARIDDLAQATATSPSSSCELGIRSAVGTPIVIQGRVWGVMIAASPHAEPLPAGTEERIGAFTSLVVTAISNIQARSDLAASRARIVAATDEERRRVVRDLHDGAQQRLVHTVITLKLARRALERGDGDAVELVGEALGHAERATGELRELAHGILPSVLTHGGLRAGVEAIAERMSLPVEVGVSVGRLPRPVEASAYFLVAEALTNVAKHSRAGRAQVTARIDEGTLQVQVRDDGVGGARPGSGLLGLADRLAVLDGRLDVESPADGGTLVVAAIPLTAQSDGSAVHEGAAHEVDDRPQLVGLEGDQPGALRRRQQTAKMAASPAVRVLVADSQGLVRAGFRLLLETTEHISVVGEAASGEEAVAVAHRLRPDVALVDATLPGLDSVQATRQIASQSRVAVIILVASEDDEHSLPALRAGATGLLPKEAEPAELVRAVETLARGEALLSPRLTRRLIAELASRPEPASPSPSRLDELTAREREVVALVGQGLGNDEIAERLAVSLATAKTHVSRAMVKLNAHNRATLVVFAYETGLVRPSVSHAAVHALSSSRPARTSARSNGFGCSSCA
jgi:DNA-binding NarL/FixJ family response regulator/signal transduction histidine kinase